MSELLLGVNIDHIATLRNARKSAWPDPVQAAFIVEQAGADCITIHLREDRRHITDRDAHLLRKTIQTRMNLEMAVTEEMLTIACSLAPQACCLVPENRCEITTEGGLDVIGQADKLNIAVARLSDVGIKVSVFIDAEENQIKAAAKLGVPCVEIHTGAYANAKDDISRATELSRINHGAQYAASLGLKVNAGHGLHYSNVKPIASISCIQELNIGHAIISRAIIYGLEKAVRDMKYLLHTARN